MNAPLILLCSMLTVIVLIVWVRLHAFLALLIGAFLVGILSPAISFTDAASSVATNFGRVCGGIGIVIALASIIGKCMMDSGAADSVCRRFLKFFGEEKSHLSMMSSGYVLAVPVFFDTVFYLLVPLARAMRVRSGRNYALYIMSICAGGAATHVFVPPTPGPLAAAAALNVDLGLVILVGLTVAVPASLAGLIYSSFYERRWPKEMREVPGSSTADLQELAARSDAELPAFWLSLLPIVLPVALIGLRTATSAFVPGTELANLFGFLGDANFALFVSTVVALVLLKRQRRFSLSQLLGASETALASAGVIILITAGGGAYGGMLSQAKVGASLEAFSSSLGIPALWLAFLLSVVLKVAQGSSTVAIITTASVMQALYATSEGLPHPVFAVLATGAGSLVGSWMNDSGFWIVSKMGGFTERETLGIWTALLAVIGITGFLVTLILSALLPLR
ncbi:MAG: SLC13 family permease [Acidobacteriota bacterium]